MPITRIARLRNYGIFADFTWPAELSDFKKYNLVYGWNGTGKTTLSRMLRSLQTRHAPVQGDVRLVIDGQQVDGTSFPQTSAPIRVFNRDFVQASVFSTDGSIAPIFVLGEESIEKQKKIEELRKTREHEDKAREQALIARSATETATDKLCIDEARDIKELLRSGGPNLFNNYDKAAFRARMQKMVAADDAAAHVLTESDRESRVKQLSAAQKSALSPVSYAVPDLVLMHERVEKLLARTVVSAVIQRLRDNPPISQWVRAGLTLHRASGGESCAFCDQTIPTGRLAELEAHFSDEYERLIGDLDTQEQKLRIVANETNPDRPNRAEVYDDLGAAFSAAESDLTRGLVMVREFALNLCESLKGKRERMFEVVELTTNVPVVDPALVSKVNAIIARHNEVTSQFQTHLQEARRALEAYHVSAAAGEYARLLEAESRCRQELTARVANVNRLDGEIRELEREIVEHLRPAQELNNDLRSYLGHDDLRMEVSKTGYAIHRRGTLAQSLSEGEMTAIALLYFLKSLEDKSVGDLSNAVVVLDDPVSSLDHNAMYAAFGYIRARTQAAAQLFVFAHNYTFFRTVRDWFHHLRGRDKRDWSIYMLRVRNEPTGRRGEICAIDPLLNDYQSDYHYLYSCVRKWADAPHVASLQECYGYPSVARRVLEAFLTFRVPGHLELWGRMKAVAPGFEEARKTRIYRFVQAHSHQDAIGDADEDLSLLGESCEVMKDVLAFMREADPEHCKQMDCLVAPDPTVAAGA